MQYISTSIWPLCTIIINIKVAIMVREEICVVRFEYIDKTISNKNGHLIVLSFGYIVL